jgi:hypothetical protein
MSKAVSQAKTRKSQPKTSGRPRKEVEEKDLRIVEDMSGRGATLDDIACVIGVSPSTLDRWLKLPEVEQAYRRGRIQAKDMVASRLFDLANEGDVTAIIFYLKAQAGWSDRPREDVKPQGSQVVVYVPDNQRAA